MSSLTDLYQTVILRHNNSPINYEKLEVYDHAVEAYNQFCGDHFHLFMKMKGDQIDSVSFHGYGCAISKASTSVLVEKLAGKTLSEAKETLHDFLTTFQESESAENAPEEFLAFAAAKNYPGREKCATLSWDALKEWMEGLGK